MNRFRRHRLRTPLSLLAMMVLLWSQLLLASHPACTLASMAMDNAHAAQANHADPEVAPCHPAPAPAPSSETSPACESHCSRSDLSQDVSRAWAVPSLGPLPAVSVVTVQHLPQSTDLARPPGPLRSWHRPTAHPASLLLI
jgi:hypothetical protein